MYTAQLMEVPVKDDLRPATQARMFLLQPPITGDDGHPYRFAAALSTPSPFDGAVITDVFAAQGNGVLVRDADDCFIELIGDSAINPAGGVKEMFTQSGYTVVA